MSILYLAGGSLLRAAQFEIAERALTMVGFTVLNPRHLPDSPGTELDHRERHQWVTRRKIQMLTNADGVAHLDPGPEETLETSERAVAKDLGLPWLTVSEWLVKSQPRRRREG